MLPTAVQFTGPQATRQDGPPGSSLDQSVLLPAPAERLITPMSDTCDPFGRGVPATPLALSPESATRTV